MMSKQELLVKFRHSKVCRTILYPLNVIYRSYILGKYHRSDDPLYLRTLHNVHEGKRCFVIGNGPSLTPEDLDKIRNEYSFASNRIYHIFPFTAWRPSYYVAIDNNIIPFEIDNIKHEVDCLKFINYKAAKYGRTDSDNIKYICTKGKFNINPYDKPADSLHDDIAEYVTWVNTVTVTAIEIAVYMGFKEIYLLGVDNNYAKKADHQGHIYNDPTVKSSYFKGMKAPDGGTDANNSVQNVDAMNYSYELAKKFADERGVKIYNATRGGKLEIFKRINLDSILD